MIPQSEHSSIHLRIHSVALSVNTSDSYPLAAKYANLAFTVFDGYSGMLWIISCSFPSPHFFLFQSFCYKIYQYGYSIQKTTLNSFFTWFRLINTQREEGHACLYKVQLRKIPIIKFSYWSVMVETKVNETEEEDEIT